MTPEQRRLWRKLGDILDSLPASDDHNELTRLWYRLGGEQSNAADWQRASELLERLDPLVLGSLLCLKTENASVELRERAVAVLARH